MKVILIHITAGNINWRLAIKITEIITASLRGFIISPPAFPNSPTLIF